MTSSLSAATASASAPNDAELTSSLLKRLTVLERELTGARSELRAKEAHLLHLQADSREQSLQLAAARAKLAERVR